MVPRLDHRQRTRSINPGTPWKRGYPHNCLLLYSTQHVWHQSCVLRQNPANFELIVRHIQQSWAFSDSVCCRRRTLLISILWVVLLLLLASESCSRNVYLRSRPTTSISPQFFSWRKLDEREGYNPLSVGMIKHIDRFRFSSRKTRG